MTNLEGAVQLGQLVVAAFDEASHHSADPREVSRLATRVVLRVLRRTQRGRRSAEGLDGGERLLVSEDHLLATDKE